MIRRFTPLFLTLALLLSLFAPPARSAATLAASLDQILAAPALQGGITGAVVVRLRDGKTLYSHNPGLRLLPASNRKLFTAAAALGVLGDNFTYHTTVLAASRPDADGVLKGDIILRGDGDGALLTSDLDDLAAQLQHAGVKQIVGSVFADDTLFTDGPYGFGWEWDDFSDEEFPKISSLEVNHGDIAVTVKGGESPGQPLQISLDPPLPMLSYVRVNATTSAANVPAACRISLPYEEDHVNVEGTLPPAATFTQNVPAPNPSYYTAEVFSHLLSGRGIHLSQHMFLTLSTLPPPYVANAFAANKTILATHTSLPLTRYLPLMMKPSDNLIAESLVRTLATKHGKDGSYDNGHALETPFFTSLGVNINDVDLRDGCGVSRRDFVTARAIGQLLLGMSRRPDYAAFYNSLPIAGVDGTLKSRFIGTRAQNNVHAKTGTLSQARALSGYFTARSGGRYAFSLLMNNFPGNAKSAGNVQDKFVVFLIDAL